MQYAEQEKLYSHTVQKFNTVLLVLLVLSNVEFNIVQYVSLAIFSLSCDNLCIRIQYIELNIQYIVETSFALLHCRTPAPWPLFMYMHIVQSQPERSKED
jgi:hypothetical protein